MKNDGLKSVSYETIYQMIYEDYQELGTYKKISKTETEAEATKRSQREAG
jgi:hypothetical protein